MAKKENKNIHDITKKIETENINELLIEIQKSSSYFEKGETYLIQADLLFETDKNLWNKLL